MLKELYIENLAVIEKASCELCGSFNVFTGETGAGKSILINGINAILGQRSNKDIVRSGTKKAVVSALFTDVSDSVRSVLEELGIECEDGQLLLTREISVDGGSLARINSRVVNASALRQVGELLVNIHGQHDNQILMSPERHIDILDSYADSQPLLDEYREAFRQLQAKAKQINKLKGEIAAKSEKADLLRERYEELKALDIREGEDDEIEAELNVLKNAVTISEALYGAAAFLSGDDDRDGAVTMTQRSRDRLSEVTEVYEPAQKLYERLESAAIELSDISDELSSLLDKLDVDPARYDYLNSRWEELRRAKKKYGPELSDVLTAFEETGFALAQLESADEDLDELNAEMAELLKTVTIKANALSDHRMKAAQRFTEQVAAELEFLNMPDVKICVDNKKGKLTVSGLDNIEFLISANAGEEPKPIAKIASGGELSRIMLALKNVIAEKDDIETLIFDEIDTGVSGRAAQKIGIKLKQIASLRQVICVTHLSQIAVMADEHLLIEKRVEDGRTKTCVRPLDHEGRKRELARIMGGENITELMLENAEQYLTEAAGLVKSEY
ncbi:MAG: DNA repair protein RecN [Ruminococcus sp.]|nr:DNA repair protein RecN [Ruminococcus sp.]